VRVARGQLQTGKKLIDAEQQQLKSAEAQLKAGAGDRQDVFNARLEAASAALTQLDNEEKLQTALGELEDALQSPADQIAGAIQKISTETAKERQP
jgi:outer membrane protein TolC